MAKYTPYFIIDSERFEAKCKLCVDNTIIKFSKSSKTNLKTHVEGVHKDVTPDQKAAAAGSSTISVAFMGAPTFSNQESLTEAIVDMIIQDKNSSTKDL